MNYNSDIAVMLAVCMFSFEHYGAAAILIVITFYLHKKEKEEE